MVDKGFVTGSIVVSKGQLGISTAVVHGERVFVADAGRMSGHRGSGGGPLQVGVFGTGLTRRSDLPSPPSTICGS